MNSQINKLLVLLLLPVALWSCEKDEDRLTISTGAAPILAPSTTTPALSADQAEEEAITFSWTPYEVTWSEQAVRNEGAVRYTLQFAAPGTNFDPATNVVVDSDRQRSYTVAELNALLAQLGVDPGSPAQVEVRVLAEIAPNVEPVYSNTVTITATPYVDEVAYPSVYLPGGFQGWSPEAAPAISQFRGNTFYEGYVNFPGANTEFKITPERNWDNDYGNEGTPTVTGNTTSGKLTVRGENLKVADAGYYRIRANLTANTWSATRTTWGVIGSATAGGWDADQDLTYDPADQVWRTNLALTAGEIKFRANDAWDINFGDDEGDGRLEYGAANIEVPEAGNYEVTLNLSNPGNYSYSLRKL